MLQVQLLVPTMNTDATFTANMKREAELEMELKSDIKVMAATSEQKIKMTYCKSAFQFFDNISCSNSMSYACLAVMEATLYLDFRNIMKRVFFFRTVAH